jgi:Ni,Fe-hydrogenase III small subunit
MGKLILTGLTKNGRHNLKLDYQKIDESTVCIVVCTCGFQKRIVHFETYAGVKELEAVWKMHVGEINGK